MNSAKLVPGGSSAGCPCTARPAASPPALQTNPCLSDVESDWHCGALAAAAESLPLHPSWLLEHHALLWGYPPANLVLGISQLLTQPRLVPNQPPQHCMGPGFLPEAEMALGS